MDTLTEEMEIIAKYFDNNELIINLKKGKTETMIIGTAKRLSMNNENFKVTFRNTEINHVNSYKYLGVHINDTLTFQNHFNKIYKKASARLRLLERIRPNLDQSTARLIYQCMIVPIMTYSGTINVEKSNGQLKELSSFTRRAQRIISDNKSLFNIQNDIMIQSSLFVRKCIDGNVCDNFKNYFDVTNHKIETRNNKNSIRLPKVKLSSAQKGFYYTGAKIYNKLPDKIRNEKEFSVFKGLVKQYHFSF